jgi:predicted amidohydrolase
MTPPKNSPKTSPKNAPKNAPTTSLITSTTPTPMSDGKGFRVGLIQMRSGRTPAANVDAAAKLIGEARAAGADYVQTPEMTNILEARREALMAAIAPEERDPSLAAFCELARRHALWLHVGSLALKVSPDRAANRSFLIGPDGAIAARYDKIHMFDVDLANGESYRESRSYAAGEHAVVADLPWGRLGITICYDLRFPALYRALAEAGSDFLAIPAAFTKQTGEAHWQVLNRARAIENGCFVLAAAQGGHHENGRDTFGHSIAIDPWGRVLAEGETEPGVVMAEIDPTAVAAARARIPSLPHGRRFELREPAATPAHLRVI